MSFIKLVLANVKRFAKNPSVLSFSIIVPILAIFALGKIFHSGDVKEVLAVIDHDKTVISQELTTELSNDYDLEFFSSKDKIDLEEVDTNAILTIDKGYGKAVKDGVVPNVSLEEVVDYDGNKILLSEIEIFINNSVKSSILGSGESNVIKTDLEIEESNMGAIMAMLMLIYYCMMGTMMINDDVLKLKQQNVLKRSLTTANQSRKIIGALFTSSCLFTTTTSTLAFIAVYMLGFIDGIDILSGIITIVLANLIFVATTIFVVRWFKDPKVVAPVSSIGGAIMFLLGILGIVLEILPQNLAFLEVLAAISPYYWMSKILSGDIIIGAIVLLLIGGAVFTAGSYKLKDFVQN